MWTNCRCFIYFFFFLFWWKRTHTHTHKQFSCKYDHIIQMEFNATTTIDQNRFGWNFNLCYNSNLPKSLFKLLGLKQHSNSKQTEHVPCKYFMIKSKKKKRPETKLKLFILLFLILFFHFCVGLLWFGLADVKLRASDCEMRIKRGMEPQWAIFIHTDFKSFILPLAWKFIDVEPNIIIN